jgi:hypothetical protein
MNVAAGRQINSPALHVHSSLEDFARAEHFARALGACQRPRNENEPRRQVKGCRDAHFPSFDMQTRPWTAGHKATKHRFQHFGLFSAATVETLIPQRVSHLEAGLPNANSNHAPVSLCGLPPGQRAAAA